MARKERRVRRVLGRVEEHGARRVDVFPCMGGARTWVCAWAFYVRVLTQQGGCVRLRVRPHV